MQPHSMCAVAFCKFYWNQYDPITISGDVVMRVEYQTPDGAYKFNEYRLSNIRESNDRRELTMYIIRSSGGISCEITARRNSLAEGAEIVFSHSQNHVSGLREVFGLLKKRISSGIHYNSEKYKSFEGEGGNDHRDKLVMYCEVKRSDGSYVRIPYTLEITSINYKKVQPEVQPASQPVEQPEQQQPTPQTSTQEPENSDRTNFFGWRKKDKAA